MTSDLRSASSMARHMVAECGMSDELVRPLPARACARGNNFFSFPLLAATDHSLSA